MSIFAWILSTFWRLFALLTLSPSPYSARRFDTYEEWKAAQDNHDELRLVKEWAVDDVDRAYQYQSLRGFKVELETARRQGNLRALCTHLRYQSWSRNICNILSPSLYQRSHLRTKKLIRDYLREVRRSVAMITGETNGNANANARYAVMVSKQEKRDLLRDMQSSLGKTALLMQGGALISMCHLGVVKALHEHSLLPRIIIGTGTGALIAALIATTPDTALLDVLAESRIDLGAFSRARASRKRTNANTWTVPRWWNALVRRARRFASDGHFFDIQVLADCARDNLGDLTFEEAYERSGLVLNITIAMPEVAGTPVLLNYITAPHVLVWSAVAASVATSRKLYAPAHLHCKDDTGQIRRYFAVDASEVASGKRAVVHPGSALERIGELFNVNHFVVSQTRPYMIPFVKLQEGANQIPLVGTVVQLVLSEFLHWLHFLKWSGFLPAFLQRTIIDETLPNTEKWSKIVVAPQLSFRDYFSVLNLPTEDKIKELSIKGERCVWPKLRELHVRCSVELDIDAIVREQTR